jgi:hypothetical protein
MLAWFVSPHRTVAIYGVYLLLLKMCCCFCLLLILCHHTHGILLQPWFVSSYRSVATRQGTVRSCSCLLEPLPLPFKCLLLFQSYNILVRCNLWGWLLLHAAPFMLLC